MSKKLWLLTLLFIFSNLLSITIVETEFRGNKSVSLKELTSLLNYQPNSEFDYAIVQQNIPKINNLYRSKGFLYVDIKPVEVIPVSADKVKVIFTIEESMLNTIHEVHFSGNYAIKDQIFHDLISQREFNIGDIAKLKQLIIDQYSQRGYFFAEISIASLTETEEGAIIEIIIDENKPFSHKFYKFKGNKVSKEYSLIKLMRLNSNAVITPKLLRQTENKLLTKSYISECSINPLDYETLLIDITESKMTNISGIIGYNSKNDDYPFTGFLDLAFNNLFGSDRVLKFKWNKLQQDRSTLALAFHETGHKDYYFSSDIDVLRTEYDTIATLSELGVALNYDFPTQEVGIYGRYSHYDIIASSSEEESEKIKSIGFFWQQNSFDQRTNPRHGHQIRYSLDYNISSLDDDKYNINRGYFAKVFSLSDKIVLYDKVNANYSTKKNLSPYNSFKLGGFNTLRGFQEEQFSGYLTAWNNLELRYIFGVNNNIFIFTDAGYVESMLSGVTTKQGHLYSTGLGLRIATKVGNLTFEYGVGYNDGWSSLYDGLIHFGIETSF